MSDLGNEPAPTAELQAQLTVERQRSERSQKRLKPIATISLSGLTLFLLNATILHLDILTPTIALALVLSSICAFSLNGGVVTDFSKEGADAHIVLLAVGLFVSIFPIWHAIVIDFGAITLDSMLIGCALILFAVAIDKTARSLPFILLGSLVVSVCFGYGAVQETNMALDRSPPDIFHVPVIKKDSPFYKGSSTRRSYQLTLAPWGPESARRTIAVDEELFNSVPLGGAVCIDLRAGGLGIRWYQGADRCANQR